MLTRAARPSSRSGVGRAFGRFTLGCALACLATFGCTRADPERAHDATPNAAEPAARPSAPEPTPSELIVLAAASLTGAFESLEDDFEARHPGIDVRFSFAGTQELRRQLEAGAQAGVFASADEKHMQALVEQGLVLAPHVFAENEPVMVTHAESRASLKQLADLPNAPRIVLGSPEVPIGRYSLQILDRATRKYGGDFQKRVDARVVSHELNVRQVLAKVTLGEADAGIVYRSDVTPPPRSLRVVGIPGDVNVIARYPIAVVAAAPHAATAQAWVHLIRSPLGQRALRSAGFKPVDGS